MSHWLTGQPWGGGPPAVNTHSPITFPRLWPTIHGMPTLPCAQIQQCFLTCCAPHCQGFKSSRGIFLSLPVVQIPECCPIFLVSHLACWNLWHATTAVLEADISGHSEYCGLMLCFVVHVKNLAFSMECGTTMMQQVMSVYLACGRARCNCRV